MSEGVISHFEKLEDLRIERTKRHKRIDIIGITLCGVICGADNWVDIEAYGNAKYEWLQQFLEPPNGIPAHDTLGDVFARIDPAGFQECFREWVETLVALSGVKSWRLTGEDVARVKRQGAEQTGYPHGERLGEYEWTGFGARAIAS